jgi:hypothetical protein
MGVDAEYPHPQHFKQIFCQLIQDPKHTDKRKKHNLLKPPIKFNTQSLYQINIQKCGGRTSACMQQKITKNQNIFEKAGSR